jgi:membrane protein YqaA with SNARE-associated domain
MVSLIHTDAITNTRIATAFFALIGAILGAYFGWKIGKKLYREFEPPVIKDRAKKPKTRPKEAKL